MGIARFYPGDSPVRHRHNSLEMGRKPLPIQHAEYPGTAENYRQPASPDIFHFRQSNGVPLAIKNSGDVRQLVANNAYANLDSPHWSGSSPKQLLSQIQKTSEHDLDNIRVAFVTGGRVFA